MVCWEIPTRRYKWIDVRSTFQSLSAMRKGSWMLSKLEIPNSHNSKRAIDLLFQEAIRSQKIELKEIETEYLGTEKEYKVPEDTKDDKRKTPSSKSWSITDFPMNCYNYLTVEIIIIIN